ncbi:MAG: hypothetical protein ACKVE4_03075 [Dissulfuribacterales bacterium]
MSKECREFDPEERLIDFAVRVIRTAESMPKTKKLKIISGSHGGPWEPEIPFLDIK